MKNENIYLITLKDQIQIPVEKKHPKWMMKKRLSKLFHK